MNYAIGCAVTADLNRYLSKLEREDLRDTAIELRTDELMQSGEEFSPADPDNVVEAFEEMPIGQMGALCAHIEKALTEDSPDSHYEMIGRHMVGFLKDYWKKNATLRAETDIDARRPNFD